MLINKKITLSAFASTLPIFSVVACTLTTKLTLDAENITLTKADITKLITFSGQNHKGIVSIDSLKENSHFSLVVNKRYNLSNHDLITVTIRAENNYLVNLQKEVNFLITINGLQVNPYNTGKRVAKNQDHVTKHSTLAQMIAKGSTWTSRLDDFNQPVAYVWDADSSDTIIDILDQMDRQMGYYLPIPLEQMSPFALGTYLVDMYNNNHGGSIIFTIVYQGQSETVTIDFSQLLRKLIVIFDDSHNIIDENTPASHFEHLISAGRHLAIKAGHSGWSWITYLWSLFNSMGNDLFQVTSPLELLHHSSASTRALKIINLLDALPSQAIEMFPQFFNLFINMAILFKESTIAKQWAADHHLEKDWSNLEHIMVATILK